MQWVDGQFYSGGGGGAAGADGNNGGVGGNGGGGHGDWNAVYLTAGVAQTGELSSYFYATKIQSLPFFRYFIIFSLHATHLHTPFLKINTIVNSLGC